MASIGDERQRTGQHAIGRFNNYEQGVEDDRDCKGAIMGVEVMAVIVAVVVTVYSYLYGNIC